MGNHQALRPAPEDFHLRHGSLTFTLKLKRRVVEQKYREQSTSRPLQVPLLSSTACVDSLSGCPLSLLCVLCAPSVPSVLILRCPWWRIQNKPQNSPYPLRKLLLPAIKLTPKYHRSKIKEMPRMHINISASSSASASSSSLRVAGTRSTTYHPPSTVSASNFSEPATAGRVLQILACGANTASEIRPACSRKVGVASCTGAFGDKYVSA